MQSAYNEPLQDGEYLAGDAELSDDLALLGKLYPGEQANKSLKQNADLNLNEFNYADLYHPVFRTDGPGGAKLILRVHKGGRQHLDVIENGRTIATFLATTGDPNRVVTLKNGTRKRSSETPSGWFTIHDEDILAHSAAYDGSAMPHSLFFAAGKNPNSFAIHGHYHVTGSRGSGGCVRLRKEDARKLWAIVHNAGVSNVRVNILN